MFSILFINLPTINVKGNPVLEKSEVVNIRKELSSQKTKKGFRKSGALVYIIFLDKPDVEQAN